MKVIKRILIGLVVLVVAVLVLITVSSKGAIFNSGVPLGGITFSEEKVTNFPVYPGSQFTTEDTSVTVPDDLRRVVSNSPRWNRYLTNASADTSWSGTKQRLLKPDWENLRPVRIRERISSPKAIPATPFTSLLSEKLPTSLSPRGKNNFS